MPFEVFRRHQRKLLAIFAILAMISFVLSDSLPKLLSPNTSPRDQKVAELFGKSVYRSQLNELARERYRSNLFVSGLAQFMPREVFGGMKDRDLVDAYILQHEADRLGMPANPEIGREWLKQITGGRMNRELFETLFSRFSNEVSEEQFLAELANQYRLQKVRHLLGSPVVTPLDVFRTYRDQNERVGAKLVEVPVESFLSKVPEPSDSDLQALYDKYKDVLPDPASETPGFKVPRHVQVEIMSIDGNAMSRGIKDKLTEAELKNYYENHKSEFEVPYELPRDLFADQPDLTPPIIQPFSELKGILAPRLAEEKAQAEIVDKFTRIRENDLIPIADKYLSALDEQEESKKSGQASTPPVQVDVPDVKSVAQREGLNHEVTPLLSREQAEKYGTISTAEVGLTALSGGRKFAEEFFDPKTGLYEPVELTDILGTRFLARKIKDVPPHQVPLDQIRSDVALAWKTEKARPLAEKAAADLAAQLKAKGGTIKDAKVEGYRVITIPPITRKQTDFMAMSMFEPSPVVETRIPDVPYAGEAFRDAYFGLQPGSAAVAPDQPRKVYYVLTLDRKEPADFKSLYAKTNSDEFRYKNMALQQASREQESQWMGWLRQQAGLSPDWVPPDEAKREEAARRGSRA
jgi:peptidyl-prolyl cis-trans isomerase D